MRVDHRWAQAMTLIQIAIALAAITILTREKAMGLGALGVAVGSTAGARDVAHLIGRILLAGGRSRVAPA